MTTCPRCNHPVVVGINIIPGGKSEHVAFCGAMNACDTYLTGKIGKGQSCDEARRDFERQAAPVDSLNLEA